jgi:hypothetical protein
MSLIRNNQSDVRKHFSSSGKKHLHLVGSATEPDATGFSGDGPPSTEPIAPNPVSQSATVINSTSDSASDGLVTLAVPEKPLA